MLQVCNWKLVLLLHILVHAWLHHGQNFHSEYLTQFAEDFFILLIMYLLKQSAWSGSFLLGDCHSQVATPSFMLSNSNLSAHLIHEAQWHKLVALR